MSDRIRVSCASLCRIEREGRFLLLLNQNRRSKGLYVLSPIGGALALFDAGRMAEFDATFEDPAARDLRLVMPASAIPAFRAWFSTREGRESTPFRELREELVHESGLLPALEPEDVEYRYLRTVEERAFTARQGQTGVLTHYFLEIYAVAFTTSAALDPLLTAPPERGAAWVSAEQIRARGTLLLRVDGALREAQINGSILLEPPPNAP